MAVNSYCTGSVVLYFRPNGSLGRKFRPNDPFGRNGAKRGENRAKTAVVVKFVVFENVDDSGGVGPATGLFEYLSEKISMRRATMQMLSNDTNYRLCGQLVPCERGRRMRSRGAQRKIKVNLGTDNRFASS